MCVILGGLGGLIAADLKSEPAAATKFIPPREQAHDFRLRDQDGRATAISDARGQVVVLTFLYSTCWDLCPAQATDIARAVGEVGDGVVVYGVSVDPVGDTRARVRAWLESHGLTGGPVKFLIGSRRELAPVWGAYGIVPIGATPQEAAAAAESTMRVRAQRAANPEPAAQESGYSYPVRPAPDAAHEPYPDGGDLRYRGRTRHRAGLDFEHSAYVMLIDKHGVQRLGIPFELLDPDTLARDLRLLRSEA